MTTETDPRATRPRGLRILIAGTGGQGVVLAARLLTAYFVRRGHRVVSGQLHGMAQRGGSVQSTVVVDGGSSPGLRRGSADLVVGFEPVETARAIPFMAPDAVVFMNTAPVMPYVLSQQYVHGRKDAAYPDVRGLAASIREATPQLCAFDATELARKAGSARSLNMVMLGCLIGSGCLGVGPEDFQETVLATAPSRLAERNQRAFLAGVAVGRGERHTENR
ncbi:MAG: indolepyruvate oxidoreductase subunit beta [Planctomycetes bacterium]|nr:indolepyruvate oxidoreductase subunit beta [Planctomycetota bacterium]